MSKQSEAKKKQAYKGKPTHPRCRVCEWLKAETFKNDWGGHGETLRCGIGDFAVKPNAICAKFKLKDSDK